MTLTFDLIGSSSVALVIQFNHNTFFVHFTTCRQQIELLMKREEETDLFAGEERAIVEARVGELEQQMQELARLLEEKDQIIDMYEESLVKNK